jgi:hypothetical protein
VARLYSSLGRVGSLKATLFDLFFQIHAFRLIFQSSGLDLCDT